MKTSEFLAALRANPSLPVIFRSSSGQEVQPGYHLTEVKRVAFETMDCGAETHQWRETHFELWVPSGDGPSSRADYLTAGKFLRIVEVVEGKLPLVADSEAKVFFGSPGYAASMNSVAAVGVAEMMLIVELDVDQPRCKARERAMAGAGSTDGVCCSTGRPGESGAVAAGSGCGCGGSARSVALASA